MIAEQRTSGKEKLKNALLKVALVIGVLLLGFALGTALTSPSWENVITAVGWITQMGAILLDPLGGLLLWVVVSPYARFIHLNLHLGKGIPDLGLDRLAAGFFCIVMLAQVARGKRRLAPFTWLDAAIVTFALALALSVGASWHGPFKALQIAFDSYYIPFLIYFLAKNLVRDRKMMRRVLIALGIIAGYLVFLATHEQLTGKALFFKTGHVRLYGEHLRRVVSLLGNPVFFAVILDMVLPFAIWAGGRARDTRVRWGYGLASVALLGTVFSLYNRAGWLGALLALLLSAYFYPWLRRWLMLAFLLSGLILAFSWDSVRGSALFSERLAYTLSLGYRVQALNAGLQLVARQPLFGVGFDNFPVMTLAEGTLVKETEHWWLPTPHNSYLDVFVSAGLFGLLPFLAIFVAIAWESWRLYQRAQREPAIDRGLIVALWSALLAFAVPIATFDIITAHFCAMVFYLIVGAVLGSQSWPTLWRNRRENIAEAT